MRLLTFLIACLCLPVFLFAQSAPPTYVPGAVFVKLHNHSRASLPTVAQIMEPGGAPELQALVQRYGVSEITPAFPQLKSETMQQTYLMRYQASDQATALQQAWARLPIVEYVEPVPVFETVYSPNDPNQAQQWYLQNIGAAQAWGLHQGGNTVVAIVDDAVRLTHEDLAPNIWTNPGEIAGDGIDNDLNGYIDDVHGWDAADNDADPNPPATATNSNFTHGTHCAGIAAAASDNGLGTASIGFNTEIMAVKCTYDTASNSRIIYAGYQGIAYAISAGADVISLSWGSNSYNLTFQNLLNQAHSAGIVVVAAAGNDDQDTPFYPAAYDYVISVAATNSLEKKASFSNYGTWIDISAPGSYIYSSLAGNDQSYGYQSGTSMATPMVAGLCALMRSFQPGADPDSIERCLKRTAFPLDSLNPNYAGKLGAGRMDAGAAMQALATQQAPQAHFYADVRSGCSPLTVQFYDSSSQQPTHYTWWFPGGTPNQSTQAHPQVSYAQAGTYPVRLLVSNAHGTDSVYQSGYITVMESPYLSQVVQTDEHCDRRDGRLQVEARGGDAPYSFIWQTTPPLTGDDISRLPAGNYPLQVSNNQGCTFDTTLRVDAISAPNILFEAHSDANCGEQNGYILAGGTGGSPPFSYQWSNGATTSEIRDLAEGSYFLTLVDQFGCQDVDSIQLSGSPALVVTATTEAAQCGPTGRIQAIVPSGTAPYQYDWIHYPQVDGPVLNGLSGGTYALVVRDAKDCRDSSSWVVEQFGETPEADFSIEASTDGLSLSFENHSLPGDSSLQYIWDFGDGSEPAFEEHPQHQYASPGSYQISLIAYNGCGSDTTARTWVTTDLAGQLPFSRFALFPNPNQGHFRIQLTAPGETQLQLRLHNHLGQLLWQQELRAYQGRLDQEIWLPGLPAGVYGLQVMGKDHLQRQSIIIWK